MIRKKNRLCKRWDLRNDESESQSQGSTRRKIGVMEGGTDTDARRFRITTRMKGNIDSIDDTDVESTVGQMVGRMMETLSRISDTGREGCIPCHSGRTLLLYKLPPSLDGTLLTS